MKFTRCTLLKILNRSLHITLAAGPGPQLEQFNTEIYEATIGLIPLR